MNIINSDEKENIALSIIAISEFVCSSENELDINYIYDKISKIKKEYSKQKLIEYANDVLKNNFLIQKNTYPFAINIEQASKMMGVSKQLMRKFTEDSDFPCIRTKRRVIINTNLLPEWFKNHTGDFYVDY